MYQDDYRRIIIIQQHERYGLLRVGPYDKTRQDSAMQCNVLQMRRQFYRDMRQYYSSAYAAC